jgi:hypothetical protein
VPAFVEESACAQVISNSFSFAISRLIGLLDRITVCKKISKSESSKVTGQQLAGKPMISSVVAAHLPPTTGGGGTSLMICSHAEARHSTR